VLAAHKKELSASHPRRVMSSKVVLRDLGESDLGSLLSLYRHLHGNDDPLPDRARVKEIVENVVTDAKFRRRGIGSQVLRALLDRCWERRCYKVMLMSAVERAEVHAFYDSLGFERNAKQAFVMVVR
jgi:GNAT superfamily N-acetyltransferase